MKTAISIPDPLFDAAEDVADRLGVSRSQLYAKALAEYVAKHRDDQMGGPHSLDQNRPQLRWSLLG